MAAATVVAAAAAAAAVASVSATSRSGHHVLTRVTSRLPRAVGSSRVYHDVVHCLKRSGSRSEPGWDGRDVAAFSSLSASWSSSACPPRVKLLARRRGASHVSISESPSGGGAAYFAGPSIGTPSSCRCSSMASDLRLLSRRSISASPRRLLCSPSSSSSSSSSLSFPPPRFLLTTSSSFSSSSDHNAAFTADARSPDMTVGDEGLATAMAARGSRGSSYGYGGRPRRMGLLSSTWSREGNLTDDNKEGRRRRIHAEGGGSNGMMTARGRLGDDERGERGGGNNEPMEREGRGEGGAAGGGGEEKGGFPSPPPPQGHRREGLMTRVTTSIDRVLRSPSLILVLSWTTLWLLLVLGCSASGDLASLVSRTMASVAVVSLTWLGMVLGISFLEAWVKFKAPLITRAVALDIGRTVFGAFNTLEIVHASFLAFLSGYARLALGMEMQWKEQAAATTAAAGTVAGDLAASLGEQSMQATRMQILEREMREFAAWEMPGCTMTVVVCVSLLGIVLFQRLFLTPRLDRVARQIIQDARSSDIPSSKEHIRRQIASTLPPGKARNLHGLYVGLELLKALLLALAGGWAVGLFEV